jgi:hypothetical protein
MCFGRSVDFEPGDRMVICAGLQFLRYDDDIPNCEGEKFVCGFAGLAIAGLLACCVVNRVGQGRSQPANLDSDALYQVGQMLQDARDEVKKHYYDPKLNGLDWDARYREYAAMLPKAKNLGAGFRVIAAFLAGLKDSHVYFIPPRSSEPL